MARSGDPRPNGGDVILPVPAAGRVFRSGRRVRLGDVDPSGRLRLDAVARYLQDVSGDDTDDAQLPDGQAWVVRRTSVEQRRPGRFGERLELATFCSGYGRRWAERRVSMLGEAGAVVEAVTLWIHVDPATGRPASLSQEFHELYAPTAGGREVVARHTHQPVPVGSPEAASFEWRPRASDLDMYDHANNAMAWSVVEQLALVEADGPGAVPLDGAFRAEVEFRDAVPRRAVGTALVVAHRIEGPGRALTLWSGDAVTAHVTARISPLDA